MERHEKCRHCGSERLIPRAELLDESASSSGELKAAVHKDPAALFFRGRVARALKASICGECGHAELYVEEPAALYRAYLAAEGVCREAEPQQGEVNLPELPLEACLACGTVISPERDTCPACGWTYEEKGPA